MEKHNNTIFKSTQITTILVHIMYPYAKSPEKAPRTYFPNKLFGAETIWLIRP